MKFIKEAIDTIEDKPILGEDVGVSTLLNDAIKAEYDMNDMYTTLIATISETDRTEMIPKLMELSEISLKNVSELETLLAEIKPEASVLVDEVE